ncbi:uncharacterized protein G2W53_032868 [Senna tora]|uniref:Uncharacterized protein n=1 Tax=Senna tora TaxID=362788 RepID=A0A834T170_9FABA|nr:uncharacterized protein G2W53_032868 [Senna tora]
MAKDGKEEKDSEVPVEESSHETDPQEAEPESPTELETSGS